MVFLLELTTLTSAAFFGRFAPALACYEHLFFVPIDAAMGIQSFQHELSRRGTYRIVFTYSESERSHFIHQALNIIEVANHIAGRNIIVKLEAAAELEPLHNLAKVDL